MIFIPLRGDLNDIIFLHTLNSFALEEDKEKNNVESQSHIGKTESQLEKKMFESLTFDHSSLQDPPFHGFNLELRNSFIS